MTLLAKEGVAGLCDPKRLKTVDVDVPEWGVTVRLRELTALDHIAYEESVTKVDAKGVVTQDMTNFRAKLVARCAVDENGELLFTADQLAQAAFMVVERLYDACAQLNASGSRAIEDAEKN